MPFTYRAYLKNRNRIVNVTKINFVEEYIEYFDDKGNTIIAIFDEIDSQTVENLPPEPASLLYTKPLSSSI